MTYASNLIFILKKNISSLVQVENLGPGGIQLDWIRVSTEADGDHTTGIGHYIALATDGQPTGATARYANWVRTF